MNKNLLIAIVVVAVLAGGFVMMQNKNQQLVPPTQDQTVMKADENKGAVKEFAVKGSNFKFDTTEIKVAKGDTVRITFTNEGGMHDWVVDEFNAKTKQLEAGQSETVEFTADKAGTFEYYCSVGQHRANGMVGKLIVEGN